MSRSAVAIAASVATTAIRFAGNFALIPVLITFWGIEAYGVWAVYFGIMPMVLLLDMGISTILGNRINLHLAVGDNVRASSAYVATTAIFIAGAVSIGLICLATIQIADRIGMSLDGILLLSFSVYGLAKIGSSQAMAIMFGQGRYDRVNLFHLAFFTAELGVVTLLASALHKDINFTAISLMIVGLAVYFVTLAFIAVPFVLRNGFNLGSGIDEGKKVFQNSLYVVLFFIANAIHTAGFNFTVVGTMPTGSLGTLIATRTYGRVIEQTPNTLYSTCLAELTYSSNRNEIAEIRRTFIWYFRAYIFLATASVFAFLAITQVFQSILPELRTNNITINAIICIVMSSFFRALTLPSQALLIATLSHKSFAIATAVFHVAGFGAAIIFAHLFSYLWALVIFVLVDLACLFLALGSSSSRVGLSLQNLTATIFSIPDIRRQAQAISRRLPHRARS